MIEPQTSPKTFSYELLIRESHLDTFGHVNNATYLEILEEARWQLITENGYGLSKVRESGLGPTILEIHIKYMRELTLREKITVETRMLSYERKIGRLLQEIRNSAGEVCCSAEFVIGLFDTRTRKLVEPTPEWRRAVGLS